MLEMSAIGQLRALTDERVTSALPEQLCVCAIKLLIFWLRNILLVKVCSFHNVYRIRNYSGSHLPMTFPRMLNSSMIAG
jgi:hypothetical protein